MSLTYNNIQHDFRKENNLSLTEYIICDTVFFLANNPSSKVPGWCWMSRGKMAEEVEISERHLRRIIGRLEEENFLIRDDETNFLKATEKWSKVYFKGGDKMSAPRTFVQGGEDIMSAQGGDKMSANNNSNYNNSINNESEDSICLSLLEKSEMIFSEAGLKGQFFAKMKQCHSLTDSQIKSSFHAWKKKQEDLQVEFKNDQHLKNSFNRFLGEPKDSGGKTGFSQQVPIRVKGGVSI